MNHSSAPKTPLTGDIVHLLQRAIDGERFNLPSLAPVVGGVWGDIPLVGTWGPLRVDGPVLVWEAALRRDAEKDGDEKLRRLHDLRNVPATLDLADGMRITARLGDSPRWAGRPGLGVGPTCEFISWRSEGHVARWLGQLKGATFANPNLVVSGRTRTSWQNLRLQGNYCWYLLDTDVENDAVTIVVDGTVSFTDDKLGSDFGALQLALGSALQLDTLVGLDGPGNVVGAAGVHFGFRDGARQRKGDGIAIDVRGRERWLPVLFQRLSAAMVRDEDLPWDMACTAYLDAVSNAPLDGRYLTLHVALEAFAGALLKRDAERTEDAAAPSLAKDYGAWKRWVKQRRSELRAMLVDPATEETLIGKLISAMKPKSSDRVLEAMTRLSPALAVDQRVREELGGRDLAAHQLRMNRFGVDYDVDRDVERVDILRTVLAALLARACGYDGLIAGWEYNPQGTGRTSPGWWPSPSPVTMEEARVSFVCGYERPREVLTRRKRLSSRIRTRPSPKR